MDKPIKQRFRIVICTKEGCGFVKGHRYAQVGWKNGFHIIRADNDGDVDEHMTYATLGTAGTGKITFKSYEDDGPEFEEWTEYSHVSCDDCPKRFEHLEQSVNNLRAFLLGKKKKPCMGEPEVESGGGGELEKGVVVKKTLAGLRKRLVVMIVKLLNEVEGYSFKIVEGEDGLVACRAVGHGVCPFLNGDYTKSADGK